MSFDIKRAEYYNITVEDHIRDGYKLLSIFAGAGISLLAFKAVPLTSTCTQFTLFPNDGLNMTDKAKKAGLELDGPHYALLIKDNNDESGDLAVIYEKLSKSDILVSESAGIADIKGGYGVILYLKPEDCEKAAAALEM